MSILLLPIFPVLAAIGGVSDVATMRIPNALPIAMIVGFAVAAPFSGMDWGTAAAHVGVGLAAFVVGFGLFAAKLLGGGDAKFLAATILWIGAAKLSTFLLLMALVGGVLAIAIYIFRRFRLPARAEGGWLGRLHDPAMGIPYGFAIATAAIAVFPGTIWYAAFTG